MYQMLRMKNGGLAQDAVDFACRLIKTESRSLREEKVARLVEKEMKKLGYDKVFRDGAGNVVGIIYGRDKEQSVLLSSHLDTVGDEDAALWETNPYDATVKDGRIYGRGSSDCKAGVAAQVYAGALLKRSLLPLKGNLIVAAVVAEENGLSLGTRFLLSETLPSLKLNPSFAILGEPTGLALYFGHDGWIEMDIKLESANVFEMEDALQSVSNEMNEGYPSRGCQQYAVDKSYSDAHDSDPQAVLRFRSKLMIQEDAESVVRWMGKRISGVVGKEASVAVNTFLKNENKTFYTGKNAEARYYSTGWMTDPFHPMIERACQSLAAADCVVRRGRWNMDLPGMGTSGGVYLNEYNIPIVGYGPGKEIEAHAPNESVEIENLTEAVYGNAVIVHGLIGVPVCGWTMDEI